MHSHEGFRRESGRLSGFVLERQASIFLRPKLWAALTYLRSAGASLLRERASDHLEDERPATSIYACLLIEFLGQQRSPADHEALLMEQALKHREERVVAFRAMIGSDGWFRRFARSYISEAMSEGEPAADWTVGVLIAALANNADLVEELLRQRWLPNAKNDVRTWRVIERSPIWNDKLLEFATTVLHRTNIGSFYVQDVASAVGVEQPRRSRLSWCGRD